MPNTIISLAGITFQVQSTLRLADLEGIAPVEAPLAGHVMADHPVTLRVAQVEPMPQVSPALPAMVRERLSAMGCPPDHPLLSVPEVRAEVLRCLQCSAHFVLYASPNALAVLDFSNCQGVIFDGRSSLDPAQPSWLGHASFAPFLAAADALVLHAAGLKVAGGGMLLVAPDGGGKTTAARLAPHATILSDDRSPVRAVNGGFRLHGSPWGRHADLQHQAPLNAMFLLEQGDRFDLSPLTPFDTCERLLADRPHDVWLHSPELALRSHILLYRLCRVVPAYRLTFARDYIDWAAIDAVLAAAPPVQLQPTQ